MKSEDCRHFDVVIVGSGMVGATMACLLGQLPIRVALVDRNIESSSERPYRKPDLQFDPRVSALTAASQRLFSRLGIWECVVGSRSCDYQEMVVWDADGTGQVHFSAADINQATLGTIVENSIISDCLQDVVSCLENLSIVAPATLGTLTVEKGAEGSKTKLGFSDCESISCNLLIAADGANSKVRELAEFSTREWDYNHRAIVTTVQTELPHNFTALQRFMDTGPLAFLPLLPKPDSKDLNYSSIVWSALPERSDYLMALSDEEFCRVLGNCIENRLGRIVRTDKRLSFPLRQRHAVDYVKDNIVLIGDAAHTIHPLAGQGVNIGLLDASVLATEITHGLEVGRFLADPVILRRYQRKRIGHNLGMMWLMEGFKFLFADEDLPVRWLRNLGMKGVNNLSVVRNLLARRAMGLDW